MDKNIKLERIFSSLNHDKYKYLKIDTESLMYVTNFKDSNDICNIICYHINKIKIPSECLIVDSTGGIGGDTITFAKKFLQVISIEKDNTRFEFLKNNINIYELNNVIDINSDFILLLPLLSNIDIIYIDPPWGGKSYKNKHNMHIYINNIELEKIIKNLLSKDLMLSLPKIIAIKLPKNYDIQYLFDQINDTFSNIIYIYELNKMFIIIIENFIL